ncbi:unnamed protein product [Paramecium pentaurelia]|uniref:Uncharacterized protein n=1 Tax=Paramecium pentaurelia TaxID=43138 RepID=A0A8S1V3S5_9CILI|nr:unnamed protein product [Paramecium pentaurelia]
MSNTLQSYENACHQYEKDQLQFKRRKDMNLKDEYSIKEKQKGLLDFDETSQKENQTQMSLMKKNYTKYIVKMQNLNLINSYDHNVRVLDLSNSKMTSLNEGIKQYARLSIINLANNLFQEVPSCLFELYLSHINLNNNLLKTLQLGDKWKTSLERLDVGKNHIRILPDELFHLEQIKIIDLRSNDFTKIPKTILNLEKQLKGLGLDWIKYTNQNYFSSKKDMMITDDLQRFWDQINQILKDNESILCHDYLIFNQKYHDDQIQDSITVQIPKQSNITRATQRNTELTLQELTSSCQFIQTKTLGQDADLSDNGSNLMHIAVENEDIGIVRALLNIRFELSSQLDDTSHTPLSQAIKEEKYHCAKIIINASANLNIGGGEYNSVLNQAVSKTQYYLIRDILNAKVQINKQDKKGNGPLHNLIPSFKKNLQEATRIGHLLIERGADPNLRNINNNTPLHLAIKKSSYSALRFAISINEQYSRDVFSFKLLGHKGNSVMHFAAKSENIKIILQLYAINPYLLFTYNEDQKRPFDIIQKNFTLSKLISVLELVFIKNHIIKQHQKTNSQSTGQLIKEEQTTQIKQKEQDIQFSKKNSFDLVESDEEGTNRIGLNNFQILPNLKRQQSQPPRRPTIKKENKVSCENVGQILIHKSIQQDRNDIKQIELQNQQNNSKFNKNKFINKWIHKLLKDIENIQNLMQTQKDYYSQIALENLLNALIQQLSYYKEDPLTNLMIKNAIQLQKIEFECRKTKNLSYDTSPLFLEYEQFMKL